MALIAHYPLNGDLEDYSGNGNSLLLRGSGGKIVESLEGKIGKCLERKVLNDSAEYLEGKNEISLSGDFTLACWAYVSVCHSGTANGLISNHSHSHNTGAGITVRDISSTDFRISCNTGNGTSRTYYSYYGTTNIKDKWSHLVMRYDSKAKLISLWVNGVKETEVGYTMATRLDKLTLFNWSTTHSTNASYRPASKLNDVRVYDHALSEKEIKELAKAKVLHYKFDPTEEPTTNVWPGNLGIYNNFRVPATLVDTGKTYKGAKILRLGMTVDSANSTRLDHFRRALDSHGVMGGYMTFLANTKYAASILWRPVNKSDVIVGGTASNIPGWVSKGSQYEGDGWNRYTVVRTGSVTTNRTDNMFFSFICPSMQLNETVYVEFCAPQVEVGKDYSTPYVLGTRQGGVKDSSGFGNDGTVTVTTAPSWSEDSPVGRGSMEFVSSEKDVIDVNHKIPLWGDSTVSFWANISSTSTSTLGCSRSLLGKGFSIFLLDGAIRWDTGDHQWSTGHNVKLNQWVHYTLVRRGNVKELYENAVLVKSTTYTGSMTSLGSSYSIGMSQVGGSSYGNPLSGTVSDYRIYATALSPEDIKEIYQTRASIDNLGNLHSYESDEVSGDTSGITSQGIAKFTSINEVGRPVRYIRDWLNGSTSNTGNHWVEIQAIDPSGTNVALGKSSPSALLTDGSTSTNPYYSAGSGLTSVTVDLGNVHNITYLHIWHYWSDRRTYHNTKTEVSTDGTNWVTVFDSAVEGEYAESSEGKKIILYPDKVSIDSDGNIYINEIKEA